jgi:aminocarboxymuconate-semialdehyde decarboxylase
VLSRPDRLLSLVTYFLDQVTPCSGRLTHGFHARPDLCQTMCQKEPKEFLRSVYIDSLVHDPDVLELVVKKFGSDRIILGSDYPFPLGEIDYPGRLIDDTFCSECGIDDREKMLWKNAESFLKLKAVTD